MRTQIWPTTPTTIAEFKCRHECSKREGALRDGGNAAARNECTIWSVPTEETQACVDWITFGEIEEGRAIINDIDKKYKRRRRRRRRR